MSETKIMESFFFKMTQHLLDVVDTSTTEARIQKLRNMIEELGIMGEFSFQEINSLLKIIEVRRLTLAKPIVKCSNCGLGFQKEYIRVISPNINYLCDDCQLKIKDFEIVK